MILRPSEAWAAGSFLDPGAPLSVCICVVLLLAVCAPRGFTSLSLGWIWDWPRGLGPYGHIGLSLGYLPFNRVGFTMLWLLLLFGLHSPFYWNLGILADFRCLLLWLVVCVLCVFMSVCFCGPLWPSGSIAHTWPTCLHSHNRHLI